MKVTIERAALLKAMSRAQSVVERKNTIPILANVLIEANGKEALLPDAGRIVTSSFGVSSLSLGASSPQNLLDEADKSLYVAKGSGLNQVARWDMVPDDFEIATAEPT